MEITPLDTREAVRGAIRAHGRGWQEAYEGLVPQAVLGRMAVDPEPQDVDRWLDELPDEEGVAYGAVVEEGVRGYIDVRWAGTKSFVGPNEAGLKAIYVHPDWWGESLGTELLSAALEDIPDGVSGIALEVFAENDIGRGFYEAQGFTATEHDSIEIAGEDYETVIYRRKL